MKEYDTGSAINDLPSSFPKEIREFPLLTSEQEKQVELMTKYGTDEERETARITLVYANLRPILHRVKNFKQSLETEDLVQEVCVNLLSAAKKFDVDLGHGFLAYAGEYTYNNITRVIKNTCFNFIPPEEVFKKGPKIEKTVDRLLQKLGREPTVDEISSESDIPQNRIEEVFCYKEIEDGVFSLDEKELNIGGDFDLDEIIDERMIKDDVRMLLDSLDNKTDANILREKLRLDNWKKKTYREIALDFSVSHQRIAQRYLRTIKRLKSSQMSEELGLI